MYKIIIGKKPTNFFRKLNEEDQKRISKKLNQLKQNPKLGIPLIGNLSGLWKLRVGKYRLIYSIREEKLVIVILRLGHRKNIYD